MNLEAINRVLSDRPLQVFFQAALLTANEGGYTVRELSEQLGVPRSTLHRWITKARDSREKNRRRHQKVDLVYPPDSIPTCNHSAFLDKRKKVCLRCLLSNFEGAPELRRNENFDPEPEDKPHKAARFKPKLKRRVGK